MKIVFQSIEIPIELVQLLRIFKFYLATKTVISNYHLWRIAGFQSKTLNDRGGYKGEGIDFDDRSSQLAHFDQAGSPLTENVLENLFLRPFTSKKTRALPPMSLNSFAK